MSGLDGVAVHIVELQFPQKLTSTKSPLPPCPSYTLGSPEMTLNADLENSAFVVYTDPDDFLQFWQWQIACEPQ